MFPEFAVALATPLATQMSTCRRFLPKRTTHKMSQVQRPLEGGVLSISRLRCPRSIACSVRLPYRLHMRCDQNTSHHQCRYTHPEECFVSESQNTHPSSNDLCTYAICRLLLPHVPKIITTRLALQCTVLTFLSALLRRSKHSKWYPHDHFLVGKLCLRACSPTPLLAAERARHLARLSVLLS